MLLLGVDDDPILLELATEYFEDLGHAFVACRSQLEAQPLLAAHRFDAAMVDYHLERGTGKLLAATILRNYPKTKLVVVTGDHAPETERAVREIGVRHLLYKPFRFRELMNVLIEKDAKTTGPRLTIYGQVADDELGALKHVLLADPANDQAKWLLAFGYYRAGKYGDAAHLLKDLLRLEPDNKLALYYLGACQYRFGIYEDAVANWRRIVHLDPTGPLSKKAKEHLDRTEKLLSTRT